MSNKNGVTDVAKLKQDIRKAFFDAEFPSHCDIRAAEAMDGWVTNKETLKNITERSGFRGDWWDLPKSDIQNNSLGFNYLDEFGVVYYLPAFMTLAIDEPTYENLKSAVDIMDPVPSSHVKEQARLFYQRFSKINGCKKATCKEFLRYAKNEILKQTAYLDTHIQEILNHEFWDG